MARHHDHHLPGNPGTCLCMSTETSTTPKELHLRQLNYLLYCLGHLHLSLHNGRQPIQELHQWSLHGLTESNVGTCLRNNWNHQSVDELMQLGLLELALHEHRHHDVNQRRVAQYLYTALGWRCIPPGALTGCNWKRHSKSTPQWARRPGPTHDHDDH